MFTFLFIFAVFGHGRAKEAEPWTLLWANVGHLYPLPTRLSDVVPGEYVWMSRDEELNADLYSYPEDPRVSLLYDTYGHIAGVRVSFIKEDVGKKAQSKNLTFPYSFYDKPIFGEAVYWGFAVWHLSVLFVSPWKLRAGGRVDTGGEVAEDLFLRLDGCWTRVPRDECQAPALGWTKQACIPKMGMHYMYNATKDCPCGDLQGVVLMYDYGHLVSVNFNPFGAFTQRRREWFEARLTGDQVKRIYPNTASCLKSWVDDYGVTSLHVFLNQRPQDVVCNAQSQDPAHCSTL